jgi:transposase InsO family protein
VALFAQSGQTVHDFAEEHGVKPSTFNNWVHRSGVQREVVVPLAKRSTPDGRRAAVEAFVKSGRKRTDFARLWGCSPSSLDKWLKRYNEEGPRGLETRRPPKGRRGHHPKRLSEEVRELIVQLRVEHEGLGATRIAQELERFHGLKVSASTVRNVLRERGIAAQPGPKRRRRPKSKPPRRFERARPGEMWQSDVTSYVLRRQGRRVYLTVFLDDHSRYVVAWALATHQRTPLVTEPLPEGIARFGKPGEVLTDQGRQYFAWRGKSGFQKLLAKEGIQHVVSRTHHPETLGKCERLWKTVADEFWDRAAPQDLEDARRRLGHWMRHYNHFRPHQGIDGLVPADRFFGAESALREALERELAKNELRLAIDETPRKPVYLVGQIGDEREPLERGADLRRRSEGRHVLPGARTRSG